MDQATQAADSLDDDVERLVKQIDIPPCPAILTRIVREMHSDEPDLQRISQWVTADVALAAAMLKTINSPLYGLRSKATSVQQALILLGLRNVAQLITGLLLRQAFPVAQSAAMDSFWTVSAGRAAVCSFLAHRLRVCDSNQAYTFGLFRDAGMPAMLNKKKASYEDILSGQVGGEVPITRIEQERYGLTHAQVGAYFGTTWYLNESVWKAILLHHDYDKWLARGRELAVRTAAIGLVAEEIYTRYQSGTSCAEWGLGGQIAQVVLGIDEQQVEELRMEVTQALSG